MSQRDVISYHTSGPPRPRAPIIASVCLIVFSVLLSGLVLVIVLQSGSGNFDQIANDTRQQASQSGQPFQFTNEQFRTVLLGFAITLGVWAALGLTVGLLLLRNTLTPMILAIIYTMVSLLFCLLMIISSLAGGVPQALVMLAIPTALLFVALKHAIRSIKTRSSTRPTPRFIYPPPPMS